MTETIDWVKYYTENPDDLLTWLLPEVTAKKGDIRKHWPKMDTSNLTIEMRLNGVEVPVVETFKDLTKVFNRCIYEAAEDLIEEKFDKLKEYLDELRDKIFDIAEHI